ncbi:hypothetical protein [Marinoscillum pacificum]|uniref:hypothetical protein n=1 Tax=Marinoscillum pacificum TaxID=392723 RepID=UPI0021586571|nr:hypothetical protein [Marinoscillum pacificum]
MKILAFVFTLMSFSVMAQTSAENWKTLSGLEYEKTKDEYGEIFVPKFGPTIKALEGKEITLSGYIIPFEGMFEPDHLIVSSVPVASCFFCGGAGPESVAEIYLDEPVKYTAKKVTFTGKLTLNDSDVDQLMYILKEAKLESE